MKPTSGIHGWMNSKGKVGIIMYRQKEANDSRAGVADRGAGDTRRVRVSSDERDTRKGKMQATRGAGLRQERGAQGAKSGS